MANDRVRGYPGKKVWQERNAGSISIEGVCLDQFTSGRCGYVSGSVDMKLVHETRVDFWGWMLFGGEKGRGNEEE